MEEKHIKNSNIKYSTEDGCGDVGIPIHSQVIKIKQEFEIIKHPSLKQAELRRVICKISRERSRSPLGLAERPILSQ
ncbi:uncharacterized protein LOC8277344 [Ricinus communis]|uniref:uncharacterized protein LOC8277344 n=1 Tax=Ricinus communis TaxID=3988 RepID=UPI000772D210|nr:uncharacterized protein LOC8277344 [Ricinus communis]|eukprot:XP_015578945.1 uncharacterized protein LOC8277344 [Ricinus communis]